MFRLMELPNEQAKMAEQDQEDTHCNEELRKDDKVEIECHDNASLALREGPMKGLRMTERTANICSLMTKKKSEFWDAHCAHITTEVHWNDGMAQEF